MKIFGVEFKKASNPSELLKPSNSIVPITPDGSAIVELEQGVNSQIDPAFYTMGLAMETTFKTSRDRINFYRTMSWNPYVDSAIDDIVNEAISRDAEQGTVNIKLDETNFSKKIKERIIEEFDDVVKLTKFDLVGPDVFRQWYVDGQLYLHLLVDKDNTKAGISEIRIVDPRKIQKISEVIKDKNGAELARNEYYLYMPHMMYDREKNKNLLTKPWENDKHQGVKLTKDSIVFVWSGLLDLDGNIVSYLDRAIKPHNQLSGLEDAYLVYRISRAPEKRLFNIEVGDLAKTKAEGYIARLIDKYKNKTVYNALTGKIENAAHVQTMFQDYWMPQKNGKGTQVTTIGGTNGTFATEEEMMQYIKKLYRAMKIPMSRVTMDGGGMLGGRGSEISRDEIKFFKFIQKVRTRFSEIFVEILRRQLILKNIITQQEWEDELGDITFEFAEDSLFWEMKESEILEARIGILATIKDYAAPGEAQFFSKEWVQKNVLRMTDEQIAEMRQQIDKEELEAEKRDADRAKRIGPPAEENPTSHKININVAGQPQEEGEE